MSQDHLIPNVSLEIGGKTRKLVFDFNAICVADELTGINLLTAVVGELNAKTIRALLFASLLHDDPAITLDEVGSWITMRNLGNIRPAITAAWFASIEADCEDETPGEAQAQPIQG